MSTPTSSVSRQEMVNKWLEQLATALERNAAARPSVRAAGYSQRPAILREFLWWKCPDASGTANSAIWIGVSRSAWESVAERMATSSDLSVGPCDPETTYSWIMQESWGIAGELTTQSPPLEPHDSIRITFPREESVNLLLAFENSASDVCQASNGAYESAFGVLLDMELPVTLRFGRTKMMLEDILSLNTGSIVEFDRHTEEPIEVLVNGYVVARGEAVTVQGNYAVRISEIASRRERMDFSSAFSGV